jgi:hypothetical protein
MRGSLGSPELADPVGPFEVAEHQDLEKLRASRRLSGELGDQNQVRNHAADESDRPDKLLQQRVVSVSGIRRGFVAHDSSLTTLRGRGRFIPVQSGRRNLPGSMRGERPDRAARAIKTDRQPAPGPPPGRFGSSPRLRVGKADNLGCETAGATWTDEEPLWRLCSAASSKGHCREYL